MSKFQELVGGNRFRVLFVTVIGLLGNDVFHLGLSDNVAESIAAVVIAWIVGTSLRKHV